MDLQTFHRLSTQKLPQPSCSVFVRVLYYEYHLAVTQTNLWNRGNHGKDKHLCCKELYTMTRYSLNSFLTLTPQPLLGEYFKSKGMVVLDLDAGKELPVDQLIEILQVIDLHPFELDFRMIHRWANERGIDNLIEEARSPIHGSLELGETLRDLENDHARAMTVYLRHPEVFQWAVTLEHWEHRTGKKHHYVGCNLPCEGNELQLQALGNAIAAYYKKQGRGEHCQVEYYKRVHPDRHFFFAYPEDRTKGYRVYDEKGHIVRRAIRPVFDVVFEYNPKDGDLAIYARGKRANDQMFEQFCTKVLGFIETPSATTEVFDLSCLKDPDFRFEEDSDLPVESVTLKMLVLNLNKGGNQRITLESGPYQGDHRQVEAMMARSLMAHHVQAEDINIEKAKIEIKFQQVNMKKIGQITFTVGAPQYSTLSDDEKSEMAKSYLRKWGILKKHTLKVEKADAA